MTLVQGELRLVTDTPAEVSQVWVQASEERLHGTGMVTTERASEQVTNGVVSFNALPGAAVMVLLVNGIPSLTVKLLIPDKANATLRECIEAVGLADAGTLSELEELALEVARVAAQIASADQLETWAGETASAAAQAQVSKDEAIDAANRAGVHESNARQSEVNARQSELNARQYEASAKQSDTNAQSAAGRASSVADSIRGEVQEFADSASDSASSAADSASEAKVAEIEAKSHEASSLAAAERAELAAEETIQQVSGEFATRNYVDDLRESSDTYGGFQPATVDVDTLLAGGTNSNSRMYYRMGSGGNTPDSLAGVLDVTNTGYQFTQTFYSTTTTGMYQRTITDRSHIVPGQWLYGEWVKVLNDADLDEVDSYGGYQASSVSLDTLLAGGTNSNSRIYYRVANGGDTPDGGAGVLNVTNSGYQFTQTFYSSTNSATFQRTITDRSHIVPGQWIFGEWQRQAIDDKTRMAAGEARRAAVVEAGLKRRGGVVGTGGKPAIALRFDHHLQQFGDKVLPLLKQYRLPWGQMINAGNIGKGNDTWAWSKLAKEAHDSGGEVWNHALTHGDVNSEFQADQAVTLGLSRLRENLPSLWVDSWAPPGQSNYMGFTNQSEPEKFYETYPGKLVLAQHAFVRGSYPGPHHPLNGQNLIGQSHVTIDAQTSAWCQAAVRSARDTGSGLTMMLHSNYLDQSGYMTTEDLDDTLAYIAQLRDAGEIVVLSNAGILMADANTPVRQTNMLSNAGAGANTGTWSQSVTSRSYRAHLGVPHEAETWVKGTGQVTLKVEVASPTNPVTAQHQVTLGSTSQRLSVLVAPPNDTTGITVSLTGNVQHTGVNYRPI